MRIIGGNARGTKLFTLEGLETRPTLDRVKESLFNIISQEIQDSVVLDLFAGSGAIGLEFISRGASFVYFCDRSKDAVNIINKNIQKTHSETKSKVLNVDFKKALNEVKDKKIDIIYIDPPYKTKYIKESIEHIIKLNCINSDGLIIVETDDEKRIISEIEELETEIIDQRKYGRASLLFIKINRKG